MMFLQHAVLGSWVPVFQLHLHDLGFSGTHIASVYSMLAIATVFAPWVAGQLADRVLPAQWVMFGAHSCGALLLWRMAGSTRYETILILMLLNAMVHMPTLALSNMIVFRHLANRDREFGRVRLWGTASWIVMAVLMGVWLGKHPWLPGAQQAETADCLRLGAIVASALAIFCLVALPATPPENGERRSFLAAVGALRMLRDRSCAVLMLVSFLLSLGMPFAYPFGGLFLRSLGVSDASVAPLMSIGQAGEILALLLLAFALHRLGFKLTFLIGIAGWALRFGIWSLGGPWPLVVVSIGLNGICYAFVLALGQMFVDRHSKPDTRASAQALHLVATYGVGMWLGNAIAGPVLDIFQRKLPDGTLVTDFSQFYFWPALGAAVCFVIFALLFKTSTPHAARPASSRDLPR